MVEPSARAATNVADEAKDRQIVRSVRAASRLGSGSNRLLLWHYNARPILHAVARERIGFFAAAVILYVAGQALSAWRWRWLARMNSLPGAVS